MKYSYTKSRVSKYIIVLIFICINFLYSDENVPYQSKVIAGIKGGLNYANFTGDDADVYNPESIKGMTLGGFLDFSLNKYLSVQIEANYLEKGSEGFEDFYESYESESYWHPGYYFKEKVIFSYKLKYIELPILIKYHTMEFYKISPNLYCGLSAAVNIEAKMNVQDGGISEFLDVVEEEQEINDLIRDVEYNAIFGLGFNYVINKFKIFLDLRYNIGLVEIYEENESDFKNSAFTTIVGFGYILNPVKRSSSRIPKRGYK
ncbi:MAG: porin family protein [Candidatus Delongbacteria bacterium]|jgi:hypothetical protein|nr:porin family protein [Candidatus Delongbacteria bacterium]